MVDDFINRKHGKAEIKYIFDELEPILKETYGVIVYQEQVMKIASTIAGYSLAEADILRRAMGKKKADEMAKQRSTFIERAINNGFDKNKSGELFDLMAYFAGYGFNKSHSAAYALIAYQTAYLKANFRAEFMASLISLEYHDPEKMAFYIQEAKDHRINILKPDINQSHIDFQVIDKNNILFGLGGIKNVGIKALESIIEERDSKGKFKSLLDFCKRVDLRTIHKRIIESLIYSGALDNLKGNRAQKLEELTKIIDIAINFKKSLKTGQLALFKDNINQDNDDEYNFAILNELDDKIKLEKEKEMLGIYISSQPLDKYKEFNRLFNTTEILNIENIINNKKFINVIAIIKSYKIVNTKKNEKMAFITIEDYTNRSCEAIVFPKIFNKIESWLNNHNIFIIKGNVDNKKIKVANMIPIDLIYDLEFIEKVSIEFDNDNFNIENIQKLKSKLYPGNIKYNIIFQENGKNLKLVPDINFNINQDFLNLIIENKIKLEIDI
jgi:DNA polymerase-3 subunit alpha